MARTTSVVNRHPGDIEYVVESKLVEEVTWAGDNHGNAAVVATHADSPAAWPIPGVSRHGDVLAAVDGHDVSLAYHEAAVEMLEQACQASPTVRLVFRSPSVHYRRPAREGEEAKVSWRIVGPNLSGELTEKKTGIRRKMSPRLCEVDCDTRTVKAFRVESDGSRGVEKWSVRFDQITGVNEVGGRAAGGQGSDSFQLDYVKRAGARTTMVELRAATDEECRIWVARLAELAGITGLGPDFLESEAARLRRTMSSSGSADGGPLPDDVTPPGASRAAQQQDVVRRQVVQMVERTQSMLEHSTERIYQPLRIELGGSAPPPLTGTAPKRLKRRKSFFGLSSASPHRDADAPVVRLGVMRRHGRLVFSHICIPSSDPRSNQAVVSLIPVGEPLSGPEEGDGFADFRSPYAGRTPVHGESSDLEDDRSRPVHSTVDDVEIRSPWRRPDEKTVPSSTSDGSSAGGSVEADRHAASSLVDTVGRPIMPVSVLQHADMIARGIAGEPGATESKDTDSKDAADDVEAGSKTSESESKEAAAFVPPALHLDIPAADGSIPQTSDGGDGVLNVEYRPPGSMPRRHRPVRGLFMGLTMIRPDWVDAVLPLTVLAFQGDALNQVVRDARVAATAMVTKGDAQGIVVDDTGTVEPGDVLLSVDGRHVADMSADELADLFNATEMDVGVEVVVARLLGRIPLQLFDGDGDASEGSVKDSAMSLRREVLSRAFSTDDYGEEDEYTSRMVATNAVAAARASEPKGLRAMFSGDYD